MAGTRRLDEFQTDSEFEEAATRNHGRQTSLPEYLPSWELHPFEQCRIW